MQLILFQKFVEQRKENIPWFLVGNRKQNEAGLPQQMIDEFVEKNNLEYQEVIIFI